MKPFKDIVVAMIKDGRGSYQDWVFNLNVLGMLIIIQKIQSKIYDTIIPIFIRDDLQ